MRATQHQTQSRTVLRALPVIGALLAGLVLAGCSAVNLTGFKMPSFGLMGGSNDDSDAMATASIPDDSDKTAEQPTNLTTR